MNGGVLSKGLNENNKQCISDKRLSSILSGLAADRSLLDNPDRIQYIMFLLEAGADPSTKCKDGKTLSYYSSEKLRDILNQLASGESLLNNPGDIQHIKLLLQARADPSTKGEDGKTLSYYSSGKLRDILNQLASNSNILDEFNIQHIGLLLGIGADKNTKNQAEKTLSYYLDKHLFNILNKLASNSSLLSDPNSIEYIKLLLQAGVDPNTKGQDGKTLSYYSSERLRGIVNDLAIDSGLLVLSNNTKYIEFLLQAGADPNVQNEAGKTLLHYAAERNDTKRIYFFLKAGADSSIQDRGGRTPFEYVTEDDCLQGLKCLGYDLDDNSSGDDSQIESVKLSDYLFLEDSLLAKLGIPLTTDERGLIGKFCEKIRGITAQNKQESEESILKY